MTENDMEISDWPFVSAAKQPRGRLTRPLGCFVTSLLAMTIQVDRTPLQPWIKSPNSSQLSLLKLVSCN